MTSRPREAHLPALDGVRGLAIALVMARHLSLVPWIRTSASPLDRGIAGVMGTGWIGVDLFFVLSGFLITGVLLNERDRRTALGAKLGRFYWRRVLRIVPLYYAACAVLFYVVPALPYFRAQPEIATLHASAPWYWLYGVNVLEVVRLHATPFNTGHFWSLSVEEQFYLVWPFVVLGASRKALVRIVAALIVIGPIVRMLLLLSLGPVTGSIAAYTLSVARVDVLGVGALLALLYRGNEFEWARARALAAPLGLSALAAFTAIAIVFGAAESHGSVMQTAGYSTVALLMGALIADALGSGSRRSVLGRMFSGRPLRVLGKYSYCLYVVHYPLMTVVGLLWAHVHIPSVLGSQAPSWAAYGATLFAMSFAIAWLSWRVLEAPMLSLKNRFGFGTERALPTAVAGEVAAAPPVF